MQVITLDGNTVKWCPGSRKQNKRKTSKLQTRAVNVILSVLPGTLVLEEISIPVKCSGKNKILYLDIWLPRHTLAIEVQGNQHNEVVPFFQGKQQFAQQKTNDELKAEWFQQNGIPLIYFYNDETEDEWVNKLKKVLYR